VGGAGGGGGVRGGLFKKRYRILDKILCNFKYNDLKRRPGGGGRGGFVNSSCPDRYLGSNPDMSDRCSFGRVKR
jgi:hypothetical protein